MKEKWHRRQEGQDVQRLVAERLSEQGGCPHCGHAGVWDNNPTGTQRFRCKGCGKTFTATTGTPFHRLRDKAKLLENAASLVDGLSIRKTAKRLGFSIDKTFRWRHRFLDFLSLQPPRALTGGVETDEPLFVRSYKGPRQGLPRAAKKRAGPLKEGGGTDKVPVLVALQRGHARSSTAYCPTLKRTR